MKKRTRRSTPIKNKLSNFVVMYLNIRGLKSKLESLREKIEEIDPTVICITETHLLEKEGLDIEGYVPYRNDRDNLGGGIYVGVKEELKTVTTIVHKWKDVGESLWITIDNSRVKLRIGAIYAPQESRTSKERLEMMYEDIGNQLLKAKEKQQSTILIGDLNAKVGEIIKGNKPEVTKGGKLLLKLVKANVMTILNESEKCTGLWTRSEGTSNSVVDYMIIDSESDMAFESMLIDEDREFSPASYNSDGITYSDHNVMIGKFNWIWMEAAKEKCRKREIITTKGYIKYGEDLAKERVADMMKDADGDGQTKYEEWKQKIESIAKRNTTIVKKKNPRKVIKDLVRKKRDLKKAIRETCGKENKKIKIIQLKTVNEQIKIERDRQFNEKITKVVHKIKCKKGINGPNMWEVLKSLKRKKAEAATAIKSKEGVVLENPEEIKNRYLEHFVDILKAPQATTTEGEQQEELINMIFNNIMNLADSLPPCLTTKEEVSRARKELKRKKCNDPYGWNNEMLIEGGDEMDQSLQHLFNRMETERFTPRQWQEVTIKAIAKPGSILDMDNKRGLFLTEVVSKLYEKVLKNRNGEKINEYLSDYQSGGVQRRSPADNIIILSEILRQNKKLNRKTYIVYGDAVKCFDKLWLRDCLVELYKADCAPQDIQMMYTMNKDTVIEVVTPSGTTEKVEIGEIAKQSTVLGPTFCCVETDQINKIGEDQERLLGTQRVAILIFVDDVMSAGTAEDARKAIRNMAEMEVIKKFTYGLKKTNYMVVDTGRGDAEEIKEEVKSGIVRETKEYKYVGFWVNKQGNCHLQIDNKKKKMKGEVVALKSVANYHNVGETFVNVRLQLYDSSILPSLLHNMEAWNKQSKAEIKKLEQIQGNTLNTLLELPRTTPYIGLLSELGIWRIEERLIYRKLMLYNNLCNSDERRLAKRIVDEQERENDLDDSFFGTVVNMAESIAIPLEDIKSLPKNQLKKSIKKKLNERMTRIIAATIPQMTKLRFVDKSLEFERKTYVTQLKGDEVIQALRTKLNMVTIYGNYHGDITMRRLCPYCEKEDDTTEHLLDCPELQSTISSKDILNNSNIETWKQVLEVIKFNMDHRTEKCGWQRNKKPKFRSDRRPDAEMNIS